MKPPSQGSPLVDIGNLLRFAGDYPPGFVDGFLDGFVASDGHLPPRWRETSQALDLYSVLEFLTRSPNEISRRAIAQLLARLRTPASRPTAPRPSSGGSGGSGPR